MKIPFDIKYRPQIESGEYKVETKDGRPARIICWDRDAEYPILYLVRGCDGEICFSCTNSGNSFINQEKPRDLLLITPEPELSEFEQEIENLLNLADGEGHARTTIENTKRVAAELLALARKEIEKDLPRWKKCVKPGRFHTFGFGIGRYKDDGEIIFKDGWEISVRELIDNLPKEDEK